MSFKTKGPVLTTAAQSTGGNPSNDGSSPNNYTPDYTGAAQFTQQSTFTGPLTGATLAYLPAGSTIENVRVAIRATTAIGAGNIALAIGGVSTVGITIPAIAAGSTYVATLSGSTTTGATAAGVALLNNVGSVNTTITATSGIPADAQTWASVHYTVRNPDGTIGSENPYNLSN